jgi:hypothetical protein
MDGESNGQPSGRIYFGPGATDSLPRDWAEKVLTLLYERHRATFGALLAEVVTGQPFTARKLRAVK